MHVAHSSMADSKQKALKILIKMFNKYFKNYLHLIILLRCNQSI